jgi:hypothetical protein
MAWPLCPILRHLSFSLLDQSLISVNPSPKQKFIVLGRIGRIGVANLPTPEKEPYQEEQIARIHPGETTRDEIIETFGRPDVVRANNTIWIYGESRHVAYGIVIFPGGWGCWFH